jgi:hypothetical protein
MVPVCTTSKLDAMTCFNRLQIGIVSAIVWRAANENRAAIVSKYQPVFLHGSENHLIIRRIDGNIKASFKA